MLETIILPSLLGIAIIDVLVTKNLRDAIRLDRESAQAADAALAEKLLEVEDQNKALRAEICDLEDHIDLLAKEIGVEIVGDVVVRR